jgi:hypothetical protein
VAAIGMRIFFARKGNRKCRRFAIAARLKPCLPDMR